MKQTTHSYELNYTKINVQIFLNVGLIRCCVVLLRDPNLCLYYVFINLSEVEFLILTYLICPCYQPRYRNQYL